MRAIFKEAMDNESGQSSIDFLFGFGVFLVTFIFAISFIAGIFVPYQPGAIDLSSVAYRTTAILVEDPGWYIGANGVPAGTIAWETTYNMSDLEAHNGSSLRIGLAVNKTMPNVLSIDKINALAKLDTNNTIQNYSVARDSMGLNGSIIYNFNISIVMNTTMPSTANDTLNIENKTILNISCPYPPNNNVELLERNVMVDMGKEVFINCSVNHNDAGQWIRISNMTSGYNGNIGIRIFDAMGNISDVGWSSQYQVRPPFSTWSYGDDYMIYKNGVPVYNFNSFNPVTLNNTDVVDIIINNSALSSYTKYVYVWGGMGTSMYPGGDIDYFNDPTYKLLDVDYPATMRLELWSYEFS